MMNSVLEELEHTRWLAIPTKSQMDIKRARNYGKALALELTKICEKLGAASAYQVSNNNNII